MGWGSTCSTQTNFSGCSSACITPKTMREPASAWRSSNASFTATAGASGRKRPSTRARHSTSLSKEQLPMREKSIEILLVEDNPDDVALTLHAFQNHNLVKPMNFEQFTEAVQQIKLYWLLMNEPPPIPREPK